MTGRHIAYSEEECQFLREHRQLPRRELTELFNQKFGRNISLKNVCGKCKREGWSTGRNGKFEAGHTPHPDARPKGPNKTSFKTGNRPHTWRPVGSESPDKDGYIKIKVAEPNLWKYKHRLIWEEHNGPIEPGMNIRFLDGDPNNCAIENLECIPDSLSGPLNKNGYAKLPPELKPTFRIIYEIKQKCREKRNEPMGRR